MKKSVSSKSQPSEDRKSWRDDIIREADISKGTFYYYFKTKKDILIALLGAHFLLDSGLFTLSVKARQSYLKAACHLFDLLTDTDPAVFLPIKKWLFDSQIYNIAPKIIQHGHKEYFFNGL